MAEEAEDADDDSINYTWGMGDGEFLAGNHLDYINMLPSTTPWILLVLPAAGLAAMAWLYLWRRKRLMLLQTADGETVTDAVPASRKQVIAAVKDSASEPGDSVFEAIIEEIDRAE